VLGVVSLTNTLFPHLVNSEAGDVGDDVVSRSLAQLEPLNRNGERHLWMLSRRVGVSCSSPQGWSSPVQCARQRS
jgi:hypothetical protein